MTGLRSKTIKISYRFDRRRGSTMADLKADEYKTFENIKHVDENGNEFWNARELSEILMYSKWENFSKVVGKAMLSCMNSGFDVDEHFPEVRKTIAMPKSAKRQVVDYQLTRTLVI